MLIQVFWPAFCKFAAVKMLKSILSVSLALALLVSSVGFSVSRHYCLGMLANESFYFLGDESCGMDDGCESSDLHLSNHCCQDENLAVPGIEVKNRADHEEQLLNPSQVSTAIIAEELVPDLNHSLDSKDHLANAPPSQFHPSGKDILIRHEQFLI